MVCDEGSCSCTTGYGLQDGSIDLDVTTVVEELTHGIEDASTLEEDLPYVGIDYEVYVTLAEA